MEEEISKEFREMISTLMEQFGESMRVWMEAERDALHNMALAGVALVGIHATSVGPRSAWEAIDLLPLVEQKANLVRQAVREVVKPYGNDPEFLELVDYSDSFIDAVVDIQREKLSELALSLQEVWDD